MRLSCGVTMSDLIKMAKAIGVSAVQLVLTKQCSSRPMRPLVSLAQYS